MIVKHEKLVPEGYGGGGMGMIGVKMRDEDTISIRTLSWDWKDLRSHFTLCISQYIKYRRRVILCSLYRKDS